MSNKADFPITDDLKSTGIVIGAFLLKNKSDQE